jgi:hypothetical protein
LDKNSYILYSNLYATKLKNKAEIHDCYTFKNYELQNLLELPLVLRNYTKLNLAKYEDFYRIIHNHSSLYHELIDENDSDMN